MHKVIIIGAGPSGIAAAIQLKRYGIDALILERAETGGLLKNANLVENYPGFPDGISGIELIKLFKKQLENNDIKVNYEKVLCVDYLDNCFSIKTDKSELKSEFLIIASGTRPKKPDFVIPENLKDRFLYEIYPILQIKDKHIAIIGAGDAAFDYALNLSENNKISILNRSSNTKCLPLLFDRCKNNKNIEYFENILIKQVKKSNTNLELICENKAISADFVLAAIGREPELDFLSCKIKENSDKIVDTNLFIIGDVNNGIYRQTSICTGNGVEAAMKIYERLSRE